MEGKSYYDIGVCNISSKGEKPNDSINSDVHFLPEFQKRKRYCGTWTLSIVLVSSLFVSILAWHTNLFMQGVTKHLVLRNGSRLFDTWEHEPVTTTTSIYLFNYTNVERFENGLDKKLKVEEIGPYSYTITNEKVNVVFNDNGTITFQERKLYTFAPHLSNGSLSDIVVSPNIPLMSALNEFKDANIFTGLMLKGVLNSMESTPLINNTVQNLLWGYEDTLFNVARTYYLSNLHFQKFGLFAGRNGTLPDILTIHTGENDISKKGIISRINGESEFHHWGSSECNRIDGFAGSAVRPFLTTDPIYMFTKDACRRIPLLYKNANIARGVRTFHYELPADFNDNDRDDGCYCTNSDCLPSGVVNISACSYGAPIVSSNPHFLYGDKVLSEKIEGLKPNEELHKSFVDIEPNLGLVVDGVTAGQVNVLVRRGRSFTLNSRYEDMLILPVFWVKMSLDDFSAPLALELFGVVALYTTAQTLFFVVPLIAATICISLLIYRQCKRDRGFIPIRKNVIYDIRA